MQDLNHCSVAPHLDAQPVVETITFMVVSSHKRMARSGQHDEEPEKSALHAHPCTLAILPNHTGVEHLLKH
eukprot:6337950-Amphidinium_carterae.1